jgi:copper chaperone CopZ
LWNAKPIISVDIVGDFALPYLCLEDKCGGETIMAEKKLEIQIGGMHCAACARTIEKVVGKMTGVSEATVNFAAESCSVFYDPAVLSDSEILEAIEDLGYTPLTGDAEKKKS